MRNKVANAIVQYCRKNKNGFLVTGDAGFGVWCDFQKEFPSQYLNSGINEQASVGFVSGMALSGHKVFMYNIIPFALYRCYEQLRNDVCYQNLPVVIIGIGSGITYAPAGMTHYALEDIALARTIPNLEIFSPSDAVQALKILDYAINSINPVYIRIAKNGEPVLFNESIDIHKPNYLTKKGDIALIFHGSIIDEAIEAHKILEEQGIEISLICSPRVDKIEKESFDEIFNKYKKVYVLEEHFENGGLGTVIQENGYKVEKIGIKNHFIHDIGNTKYLRKLLGIDANSILNIIKEKLC